ncbi:hypothetical protein HaLaN_06887 [Haematococcus lacustris]|uniref:Uncharacterized protein n=1 Tax=Haematococcus lacustris TaxID=44745 RepID=A0A699YM94_HAELA|nr:hypothetical protein HaLaN_06887 [Haematococcus lacustris]
MSSADDVPVLLPLWCPTRPQICQLFASFRFYFAVSNVQPNVPYKFNLVNFRKKRQTTACLPGSATWAGPASLANSTAQHLGSQP